MAGLLIAVGLCEGLFGKAYGGTQRDLFTCAVQDPDGSLVIAGYTGTADVLVVKVNPSGTPLWAKTFAGPGLDYAHAITRTSDGGYAIAGHTTGIGNKDFLVLKLGPDGSLEWAKAYGTSNEEEYPCSIIQTPEGGYAVTGSAYLSTHYDAILFKLHPDGSLEWAKDFGDADHGDGPCDMIMTPDGGFVLVTYATSYPNSEFRLLKLSSDGSLQWGNAYWGGFSYPNPSPIFQTADQGFILTGNLYGYTCWIMKLSSAGSIQWTRRVGGSNLETGSDVVQAPDGGYVVTGATRSFGAGDYDVFAFKLSSNGGSLEWFKTFGGAGEDHPYFLLPTLDGNYLIGGYVYSYGAGSSDGFLLKIPPNGSYPDCVIDAGPTVEALYPSLNTVSVPNTIYNLTSTDLAITVGDPSLTVMDICPPTDLEEGAETRHPITCLPVPSGLLLISREEMLPLRIYAADGRLAYSGELRRGENRITLGHGVYLWQAGQYKGKAIVR